MTSIFDGIQTYDPSWTVVAEERISEEDKAAIKSAQVVTSKFGLSVCFHMRNGLLAYIPLDEDSAVTDGEWLDLDKCTVKELAKEGRKNIKRVFVED